MSLKRYQFTFIDGSKYAIDANSLETAVQQVTKPIKSHKIYRIRGTKTDEQNLLKERMDKIIAAELRNTIKAHGPIDKHRINSACKRISTQLIFAGNLDVKLK